jgi:hypothetical protein
VSTLTLSSNVARLRVDAARAVIGLTAIKEEERQRPEREPARPVSRVAEAIEPRKPETPEARVKQLRALLEERYPVAFPYRECPVLARSIGRQLLEAIRPDGFTEADVNLFLHQWRRRSIYQEATGAPINLDGSLALEDVERQQADDGACRTHP